MNGSNNARGLLVNIRWNIRLWVSVILYFKGLKFDVLWYFGRLRNALKPKLCKCAISAAFAFLLALMSSALV